MNINAYFKASMIKLRVWNRFYYEAALWLGEGDIAMKSDSYITPGK